MTLELRPGEVVALLGPNSAAVVNLVYLPLAFASRLWLPVGQLPGVMQGLVPFLPPYHYAQLALGTMEAGRGGAAGKRKGLVVRRWFLTAAWSLLKSAGERPREGVLGSVSLEPPRPA